MKISISLTLEIASRQEGIDFVNLLKDKFGLAQVAATILEPIDIKTLSASL